MGTDQKISQLQQEIIDGLNRCGLSVKAFAEYCFLEETDHDDATELAKFIEKFKKQLKRSSSSPRIHATLERYREILFCHRDYDRKGTLPPRIVAYPEVGDDFRRSMARTSIAIDEALEKKARLAEEKSFLED
ncbi:MAG: hypothetical protein JKY92_08355 [Magnetovibrio sp.]|nr:hypothetical protein [Magnetovibrio sp.]